MKYVRYNRNGRDACGIMVGNSLHEVDWELRDLLVLAAAGIGEELNLGLGEPIHLDEVTLLPPVVPAARIICVGINYVDHQIESADVFSADVPKSPIIFLKDESAICGAHDELNLSDHVSVEFDWEVELGVVIGAPTRRLSRDRVWEAVAGYTVVNDITARDLQTKHSQWTLGKNVEKSTPIGPWVVTRDELGPAPDLKVSLRVNGKGKQSAQTRDMIFDIPELIEIISSSFPLQPGDIVVTGTPAGVGFKRDPAEFLSEGDLIESHIEGVGTLLNRVHVTSSAFA